MAKFIEVSFRDREKHNYNTGYGNVVFLSSSAGDDIYVVVIVVQMRGQCNCPIRYMVDPRLSLRLGQHQLAIAMNKKHILCKHAPTSTCLVRPFHAPFRSGLWVETPRNGRWIGRSQGLDTGHLLNLAATCTIYACMHM
jgi:hypothetical protein